MKMTADGQSYVFKWTAELPAFMGNAATGRR